MTLSRAVVLAGLLVYVPHSLDAQGRAPELPPGEGREVVQKACTVCHNLTPVLMKRNGDVGWTKTVDRMVLEFGAQLFPEDYDAIVRYLSTQLGPGTGPMLTGPLPPGAIGGTAKTGEQVTLPEGPGKDAVELHCAGCHDLGRVVTRRTSRDWERMTRDMVARTSRPVPEPQIQTMITYLTTHFGR